MRSNNTAKTNITYIQTNMVARSNVITKVQCILKDSISGNAAKMIRESEVEFETGYTFK